MNAEHHSAQPVVQPANPKPRRRWFRFSLRTLLALTVLLSIAFGWLGSVLVRVRHERRIIAQIRSSGGEVLYDYQLTGGPVNTKTPPGPFLVRCFIGDDAFAYVQRVDFSYEHPARDEDLKNLHQLSRLEGVQLNGSRVTDKGLEHIALVAELRGLNLSGTGVTSVGLA